jgi:hypothetical protein
MQIQKIQSNLDSANLVASTSNWKNKAVSIIGSKTTQKALLITAIALTILTGASSLYAIGAYGALVLSILASQLKSKEVKPILKQDAKIANSKENSSKSFEIDYSGVKELFQDNENEKIVVDNKKNSIKLNPKATGKILMMMGQKNI